MKLLAKFTPSISKISQVMNMYIDMHSKPGKRKENHKTHIIQEAASGKTNQCWTRERQAHIKWAMVVRSSTAFRPCRRLLPLWNPKFSEEGASFHSHSSCKLGWPRGWEISGSISYQHSVRFLHNQALLIRS